MVKQVSPQTETVDYIYIWAYIKITSASATSNTSPDKMKILYALLFFTCALISTFAQECPQVKDCPLGSYERFTGVCSECTTYLSEDKPCIPDGIKCSPGHECSPKTKTCRPIFLSIHCLRAFGVCYDPPSDCHNDDILPVDHRKCRCCPMCAKDVAEDGTGCKPGFTCDQNTGQCKQLLF